MFFFSFSAEKARGEKTAIPRDLVSGIPPQITNILKHLYMQQDFQAPLHLHESIKSLETQMLINHTMTGVVYHLGKTKNDCRSQWYLTVTETLHMSQTCSRRFCYMCPIPKGITIDLSDSNLDKAVDGNICLAVKKTKEKRCLKV